MSRNPFRQIAHSVRRLFQVLDRRSRYEVALLIALGFINMFIEMLAALAVVLLLFHINDPDFSVYDNPSLQFLAGWVPDFDIDIPKLVILILGSYLLKNGLRIGEFYLRAQIGERMGANYSQKLLRRYLKAPFAFFLERSTAYCVTMVWGTGEHLVRDAVDSLMSLVSDALIALAIFIVLFKASPGSTFYFALVLGVCSLFMLTCMHKHFGRIGNQLREQSIEVQNILHQIFGGLREVKLFQREDFFLERYRKARNTLFRLNVNDGVYRFIPQVVIEIIFVGCFGLMSAYAYFQVDQRWLLPLIGTYAFCGVRLLPASYKLLGAVNGLRASGPPLDYLYEELHLRDEYAEEEAGPEQPLTPPLIVEGEDLTFHYQEGDEQWNLEVPRFRLEGGRSYAIVGESGSGKTTLLNLISGLLDPADGTLRINGRRLPTMRRQWQKQIGYVAQEPFALDDDLAMNITLGESEDEARLSQAIVDAQLKEWIDSLPDGVRSHSGERGTKISGGQRQRLAIARALFKQPSVLLFDEPTSALDGATERAMEEALLRLRGGEFGLMRVIVTHRLATARRCDEILYMSGGKLLAQGPFDVLVESDPAFRRFALGDDAAGPKGTDSVPG